MRQKEPFFVGYILLFLSAAGILTSTIFTMMAFVALWKYLSGRRQRRRQGFDFTPPVSILKPLHGSPALPGRVPGGLLQAGLSGV